MNNPHGFYDGEIVGISPAGYLILWDEYDECTFDCGETPEEYVARYGSDSITEVERERIHFAPLKTSKHDRCNFAVYWNPLGV